MRGGYLLECRQELGSWRWALACEQAAAPHPRPAKNAGLCPLPRRGGGEGNRAPPAAVPRASSCRRFRVVTSAPGRRRRGPGSRASCARPGMQAGKGALWRRSACCTNSRARVTSCLRRQWQPRSPRPAAPPSALSPAGAGERGSRGRPLPVTRADCSHCLLPTAYCLLAIGYSPRHPPLPRLIHASRPRAILAPVPLHRGRASKAFWCGGGIGRSGNHCGHAPHILGGRRDPL